MPDAKTPKPAATKPAAQATSNGKAGKAAAAAAAATPAVRVKSKKAKRAVAHGQAHVLATYNNTIVTVTDRAGNTLGWASAGALGFKGAKKSTPYAAGQVVHRLMDRLEPYGLREVDAYVNGIGSGREAAVRAFQARGVNVSSIRDVTPIPHNGVRPPKPRRV
ncbi:MAG: 30S ribosomal protein S11 [Candidatus Andersenbacteria bacterium]